MVPDASLRDRIREGVERNLLPVRWKTADLLSVKEELFADFAINTLRSVPWSHSASLCGTERGDKVTNPAQSVFIRFKSSTGRTLQYSLREHCQTEPRSLLQTSDKPSPKRKHRKRSLIRHLAPLASQRKFLETFAPVVDSIDHFVSQNTILNAEGWNEQLERYWWGTDAPDWQEGVRARWENHQAIEDLLAQKKPAEEVFYEIVNRWGGIPQKLSASWEGPVQATMRELKRNPACLPHDDHCGGRIASVSKLYAAMAPDTWVIYDSRVAAALTYLIQSTGFEKTHGDYFGVMPARKLKKRTPLRVLPGFRKIGAGPAPFIHPFALRSFVYASWLCQALAKQIDQRGIRLPDSKIWQAYHVEMVFFMLGQDLNTLFKTSE